MTLDEAREALRRERNRRGLTQTKVAAAAGLNIGTLNKIENTKRYPSRDMDLSTFLKIADVIGVTVLESGLSAGGGSAQKTVVSRAEQGVQHGGAPATPTGRAHADSVSSEQFTERVIAAVAHAVASSVDSLGERIERALAGLASGEAPRRERPPQTSRPRKHAR